jgi:heterodisulfide reductase subunit A
MSERIGFYICHCGINIAYRVRVEEVAKYVATLPNVAISRDYLFMCSDPGQELIENDIRDYSLTRVVVSYARKNLPGRLPAGRSQSISGLPHGKRA